MILSFILVSCCALILVSCFLLFLSLVFTSCLLDYYRLCLISVDIQSCLPLSLHRNICPCSWIHFSIFWFLFSPLKFLFWTLHSANHKPPVWPADTKLNQCELMIFLIAILRWTGNWYLFAQLFSIVFLAPGRNTIRKQKNRSRETWNKRRKKMKLLFKKSCETLHWLTVTDRHACAHPLITGVFSVMLWSLCLAV